MYTECKICPRKCKVNRTENKVGYCSLGAEIKVSRAALHFWEEPCISGEKGSGTVFFSGCNLRCVYCQNREISDGSVGKIISSDRLTEIFLELQEKGAENINLVTATHYIPSVIKSLEKAKINGLLIPVVYNSGGYESSESLKMLDGLVDIYMPDFKYMSNVLSKKYSNCSDYAEISKISLAEMFKQQPECKFDDKGMMKKGVLVRHLVLPGQTEDSKAIIKYLYETYEDKIYMSIMSQYTPFGMEKYPELNRKLTWKEYDDVLDYAVSVGVENAFIQEEDVASESFIPSFDLSGV